MKLIIDGEPQVKQRPRTTFKHGYAQTYTPTETKAYETKIKKEFQKLGYEKLDDVPIKVIIVAYFGIPSSWSIQKRKDADHGLVVPVVRKDVDNIAKICLDGLQGVAFDNDKFVTDLIVRKRYSEQPRVEIDIKELKI